MQATPAEIFAAAKQRVETDITQAWMTAVMDRLSPFPKSPKEIFKKGDEKPESNLLSFVKQMKAEKDRDKRRGKRDVVIRRPEK